MVGVVKVPRSTTYKGPEEGQDQTGGRKRTDFLSQLPGACREHEGLAS